MVRNRLLFVLKKCWISEQWQCMKPHYKTFSHFKNASHLQGKDGGNRFMVTDSVLHVASVVVLCHFGPTSQPWHGATLPCTESPCRRSGSQTPQDAVSPSWFALLPTGKEREIEQEQKEHIFKYPMRMKAFSCFSQGTEDLSEWILLLSWVLYHFISDFILKAPVALRTSCRMCLFQHQTCTWEGI